MPLGVDLHHEGRPLAVARRQDVGGGPATRLLTGHVLDEVLVVVAKHRQDPFLQRAAHVVGLEDGAGGLREELLQVLQHRACPAPAPGRVLPERVELVGGIAEPAVALGDLLVGSDHQAVRADDGQDDGHGALLRSGVGGHLPGRRPA
jgi:hypothetical protein